MRAIYFFMTLHLRIRKAFGISTAGLGLVSMVPGVGPVVGAMSAVLGALAAVVRAFFEGLSICVANPVVLLVIAATFGSGVWAGIDWDRHKVEVANAKVTSLQQEWKQAEDESSRRLAGAMEARKAAEEAAKENEARAARAAADADAAKRRVRILAAKSNPASAPSDRSSVSWLPSLFGGDKSPHAK